MSSPSLSPTDKYMFKRDHRSMARLNYNHWLHTQLAGYTIHPSIPTSGAAGLRIADIGTGTAILPISLSAQLLQTASRIDGFDISAAGFPPTEWLPRNVHLHTHDAFAPFAEEFRNAYDIVHVRYFMTLVEMETLGPLIQNLMTLLKPGGYLQWSEPDMSSTSAASISPSAPKQAAERLVQSMQSHAGTRWVPQLSARIAEAGLEVVADDRIPVPDAYRMLFNLSHLITFEDVVPKHSSSSAELTTATGMVDALKSEFLNGGVSVDQSFVCVVARRSI